MIVFPHCKINLGLRIRARRPDGFHELSSLFFPVPLYDALEFVQAPEPEWLSGGLPLEGPAENNLIFKAYRLLVEQGHQLPQLRVFLYKAIPHGAGLGGGSSDAAFMLKALNDTFSLHLSSERLYALAGLLGSDCPFFLQNQPCLVSGRGELLEPFELNLSGYRMLLLKPSQGVSTAWAYGRITPSEPPLPLSEVLHQPMACWKDSLVNDFETPVFQHLPALAAMKQWLYDQGALYASMTGSGSALYGLFDPASPWPTSLADPDVQEFRVRL